jgi:hypothetical protein
VGLKLHDRNMINEHHPDKVRREMNQLLFTKLDPHLKELRIVIDCGSSNRRQIHFLQYSKPVG